MTPSILQLVLLDRAYTCLDDAIPLPDYRGATKNNFSKHGHQRLDGYHLEHALFRIFCYIVQIWLRDSSEVLRPTSAMQEITKHLAGRFFDLTLAIIALSSESSQLGFLKVNLGQNNSWNWLYRLLIGIDRSETTLREQEVDFQGKDSIWCQFQGMSIPPYWPFCVCKGNHLWV